VYGCDHPKVAEVYHNMGTLYLSQGKNQEALEQYQISFDIRIRVLGCNSLPVAESYHDIGTIYGAHDKYERKEQALEHYQKSLEIKIRVYGQDHPSVANSKYYMGLVYVRHNEMVMALDLFLECQQIYSKVHGPGHSETVKAADAALRTRQCLEESVLEQ